MHHVNKSSCDQSFIRKKKEHASRHKIGYTTVIIT